MRGAGYLSGDSSSRRYAMGIVRVGLAVLAVTLLGASGAGAAEQV